jgi:hypothetical protein
LEDVKSYSEFVPRKPSFGHCSNISRNRFLEPVTKAVANPFQHRSERLFNAFLPVSMLIRAASMEDTLELIRLDTEASGLLQNANLRASPPKRSRPSTTVRRY